MSSIIGAMCPGLCLSTVSHSCTSGFAEFFWYHGSSLLWYTSSCSLLGSSSLLASIPLSWSTLFISQGLAPNLGDWLCLYIFPGFLPLCTKCLTCLMVSNKVSSLIHSLPLHVEVIVRGSCVCMSPSCFCWMAGILILCLVGEKQLWCGHHGWTAHLCACSTVVDEQNVLEVLLHGWNLQS